jgi:AcrR family transcriptional regulator
VSEPTLRRDAALNRARVLTAAEEVFGEHGFSASVEEVARRAGVGTGTLYRRFPTKDALIAELVGQFVVEFAEQVEAARLVSRGMGLEQFMYRAGEMLNKRRGLLLLAKTLGAFQTDQITLKLRACIGELLADAHKYGRISPDIQVTDIDLALWSMAGIMQASKDVAPTAWRRQLAIMLAGMRPTAEPIAEPPLTDLQAEHVRASVAWRNCPNPNGTKSDPPATANPWA